MRWIDTWIIAIRPFAFPASVIPVILGTVLAVVFGGASISTPLFLASLISMMALHAGANILSDINDFKKGLDKVATPVSGAVIRGILTPAQAFKGSLVLFSIGGAIGLYIASQVGYAILIIGVVGVLIGALYTASPIALKYHRLGDLAVFLNFGTLGALGAWIVQTGAFSWLPIIWSIPLSLLVVAILHANNWRDIPTDTEGKIATVASLLGDVGSKNYYGFLIFGPFLFVVALVILSAIMKFSTPMPPIFLLVLLALPRALNLWQKGATRHTSKNPMDFIALDGATAQLNTIFGVLTIVATILYGVAKELF